MAALVTPLVAPLVTPLGEGSVAGRTEAEENSGVAVDTGEYSLEFMVVGTGWMHRDSGKLDAGRGLAVFCTSRLYCHLKGFQDLPVSLSRFTV